MTTTILGERAGKEGKIRLGCVAAVFDEAREKVLLTQRADNGQWCLPGGGMEAGESAAEACERELWEETGLRGKVKRLLGIYSDPNRLVVYPDGRKVQIVALVFEVEVKEGSPALSSETTAFGFFTRDEALQLELFNNHAERVRDIFAGGDVTIK
jgi:8-oxo-dGTP pyrophosphatase MutT (NUDIX family)